MNPARARGAAAQMAKDYARERTLEGLASAREAAATAAEPGPGVGRVGAYAVAASAADDPGPVSPGGAAPAGSGSAEPLRSRSAA